MNIIIVGINCKKDSSEKINNLLNYNAISGFISIEEFIHLRKRLMIQGNVKDCSNFTNEKFEANKKNK